MAKEDEVLARYLSDDERYADLINGVSFGGRQVVLAEDLSDRDSKTGYHKGNRAVKGKSNTKYRDLFRKASFGANFAVVGIENQKQVHYLMPLRSLEYDLMEYQRQEVELRRKCKKKQTPAEYLSGFPKDGKLHPCITIVLYYGDDWDGSTDLYGLLDFTNIPEELKGMVNNYKINLLDIKKLENTEAFHTDIKQVFDFIRHGRNIEKIEELVNTNPEYRTIATEAYDVIAAFTNSDVLMLLDIRKEEGGTIDMCKALDDLQERGRLQGIEQGIERGLHALVLTLATFMKDEEAIYQAVVSNDLYKGVSKATVLKYLT